MDTASATQLRNIETQTGITVDGFATLIAERGPLTHGGIMAVLKTEHGMSHGNANLMARLVREQMAGGPPPPEALLDAQYSGAKTSLRPIHDRVVEIASGFGPDVTVVVQKTGVSLRRRRQFAVVQAPAASRVQLGLNLETTPDDPRIIETTGMCSHRVDLPSLQSVDDDVVAWLERAYSEAG
ncbi:MAG: DUF5655 domain-containing protein [Chloroflexota bacterium]